MPNTDIIYFFRNPRPSTSSGDDRMGRSSNFIDFVASVTSLQLRHSFLMDQKRKLDMWQQIQKQFELEEYIDAEGNYHPPASLDGLSEALTNPKFAKAWFEVPNNIREDKMLSSSHILPHK